MTGTAAALGAVAVAGLGAGPGLAGLVQTAKARLQGRRGTDPLQPYRDLRRLWRRTVVDPEGTGVVYRTAPALIAALVAAAGPGGRSWAPTPSCWWACWPPPGSPRQCRPGTPRRPSG